MEVIIGLLSVAVFYLFCRDFMLILDVKEIERDLEKTKAGYKHLNDSLSRELQDLRFENYYTKNLSQIEEYCKLKGYFAQYRNFDELEFWRSESFKSEETLELYKVNAELEKLKSTIERNCPKKCAKKK